MAIASNSDMRKLCDQLISTNQQRFASANMQYWLTRAWRSLVWQPIYACIGVSYNHKGLFDPNECVIRFHKGETTGFFLHETHSVTFTQTLSLHGASMHIQQLEQNAVALSVFLQRMLDYFGAIARINKRNMQGLAVDFIHDALRASITLNRRESPQTPQSKPADAQAILEQRKHSAYELACEVRLWSQWLGLTDARGQPINRPVNFPNPNPICHRRACCKHNLIAPSEACDDCPSAKSCKTLE